MHQSILSVLPGEPGLFMTQVDSGRVAYNAGVRNEDRLLEVNGENIESYTHDEVVEKIKLGGKSVMLLLVDKETDSFYREVDKGSPADKAGLRKMDRVVAVNGTDVDKCSHKQVVDWIRLCDNTCSFLVVDKDTDQMYKQVSHLLTCSLSSSAYNIDNMLR
uniref:PDZ domain-containing protein n=1 Tax=Poecilia mexicana TaxID=48701 RepID=A0A3B3X1L0_9TELE